MAKGFEASTWIDRPRQTVWAAVTDLERAPDWMPGIEAVRSLDGAPAEGARFAVTMTTKGRGREREMTLARWAPPDCFALASQEGAVTALYTYSFSDEGAGTRVQLHGTCRADGLIWRLLHPLIVMMIARHDRPQMDLMKAFVEGGVED